MGIVYMLIDKKGKWLFISTMKCATNTIYKCVEGRRIGGFHARPKQRRAPLHWTIKRNPYDRALSIWRSTCLRKGDRYLVKDNIIRCGGNPENFTHFCLHILGKRNDWLFRNQSDWWAGTIIDKYIDINNLKKIEIITGQKLNLTKENTSPEKFVALNSTCIDIINKWAEPDFKYGYTKL